MTTSFKVSICLPTFNRPALIAQCIDSCLAQTHTNIELLIGDDSTDASTQQLIAARYADDPRIRYTKNEPPLGQARNVASLIERATGHKILLIHDDDSLVATGIERLLSPWSRHPDLEVAFGDQYELDSQGQIDHAASRQLNADFHRTKIAEGLQTLPGRTGLIQMFPNNGWLANADLVKRVGYDDQYGTCCDFVFGTQLCLAATKVYYLSEYVSCYRKTAVSISQRTRGSMNAAPVLAYAFVCSLTLDPRLEPARRIALRRLVPIVVSAWSKNGDPRKGLEIALIHLFAYNYGFSLRLYYHLLLISRSMLAAPSHVVP
ncbi:MAG TPA: glycosyltransferase family 2 protein [Paraburkholderia sp.]|jgi:glycosyltransferase involved in cell wall biosynthesis|nr:glycosyltransferase family 2 protein [Paraburkholderia sp.]